MRKKLTFEELEELKEAKANVNKTLNDIKEDLDVTASFKEKPEEKTPQAQETPTTTPITKESNA